MPSLTLAEFQAKVENILSEKQFLHRSLEEVALKIKEDPADILRFCRERSNYSVSYFKSKIYLALASRLEEEVKKESEKIEAAQNKEPSETEPGVAEVSVSKAKTSTTLSADDWKEIFTNISHCHTIMTRTSKKITRGEEKILAEQVAVDLEKLYSLVSKKTSFPIS